MHDSQGSHSRQTPWFSAQELENIYEDKFQIFVIATIEWDSSFQTTDKAIALKIIILAWIRWVKTIPYKPQFMSHKVHLMGRYGRIFWAECFPT